MKKCMHDLMAGLMQFEDEEGRKLSDSGVVDNMVARVIGAYEPTALSIMWAVFYLAKCPNVLNKLRVSVEVQVKCLYFWLSYDTISENLK